MIGDLIAIKRALAARTLPERTDGDALYGFSRAGPARPGRRPTTFSASGTRPGSRVRASRCSGEIPIGWPPWPIRFPSSTSYTSGVIAWAPENDTLRRRIARGPNDAGKHVSLTRAARSAFPAVVLDAAGPSRKSGKEALEWRESGSHRNPCSSRFGPLRAPSKCPSFDGHRGCCSQPQDRHGSATASTRPAGLCPSGRDASPRCPRTVGWTAARRTGGNVSGRSLRHLSRTSQSRSPVSRASGCGRAHRVHRESAPATRTGDHRGR